MLGEDIKRERREGEGNRQEREVNGRRREIEDKGKKGKECEREKNMKGRNQVSDNFIHP